MRHDKLHLSGHFSARLLSHQRTWLPCELEALAIAASVKHFSPYIIQSHKPVCVLTDSKPCVKAAEKLCRGEFSASPRVATFLSTVSRFQVSIRHLAGTSNAPSDFGSRNAPSCTEEHCQICIFIRNQQDATVLHVVVQDVLYIKWRNPLTLLQQNHLAQPAVWMPGHAPDSCTPQTRPQTLPKAYQPW